MISMHEFAERLGLTGFRLGVTAVLFGLTAPQVLIVCMAAGLGTALSGVISVLVCGLAAVLVSRVLAAHLPSGHRVIFVLWCVLSLVAVYQLGKMSVFMLDAEKTAYAVDPSIRPLSIRSLRKPFYVRHSCLTAYVVGGYLAGKKVENVYDVRQYRSTKIPTPIHTRVGRTFTIDEYLYPPPFLILPRLLFAASDDFFQIRTYWFALNVLVAVGALGAIAIWIGGRQFSAYWLSLPIVLAAPNLHATFQIGNAHFLIVCLAVLGMLAFEKRRDWIGAGLLGFAIVSKIFPGVLLAYLFFRRQWGPVFWTGAAIVGLSLVTLVLYGDRPFLAFVEFQLPSLASGDMAAIAKRFPGTILENQSIMGAVSKLDWMDLLTRFEPAQVAELMKIIFAIMLVGVTAFVGLKHARGSFVSGDGRNDERQRLMLARTWLALIVLGQMLSPFLPTAYGNLAVLWLIGLSAGPTKRPILRGLLVALGWLLFAFPVPFSVGPKSIAPDMAVTLFGFFVAAMLAISVLIWAGRMQLSTAPAARNPEP